MTPADGTHATPGPLDDQLRAAGARMVLRGDRQVAADFGSVSGEVAVCRHTVGLVDRCDRVTLELVGAAAALDVATRQLTGRRVGRGTAVHLDTGWLCRLTPERVLVRCDARDAAGTRSLLQAAAGEEVTLRDASADHAAVGLVGPHAEDLLRSMGLPEGTPIARVRVRTVPAILLREDEHCFELIEDRADAPVVWEALREAGRAHGVSCVGCEALEQVHAAHLH